MQEKNAKGTVTSFASMFPADEAQKAAKRVEEAIAEKQKTVDRIKDFITENANLVNLVSKLPEDLHHDVMVPFGKAAFFPGRLMHTNEFMVLLGEGYYVERTAKQTVDILKRRGKALDSQVQSLKANMEDLKAEASFFGTTASEAAEGIVEIREDFEEKDGGVRHLKSEADNKTVDVEGDEYARMMARLDELEEEELAAEGDNESNIHEHESDEENDKDDQINVNESDNESDTDGPIDMYESEKIEQINVVEGDSDIDQYVNESVKSGPFLNHTRSEVGKPQQKAKVGNATVEVLSNTYQKQLDIGDHSNVPTPANKPSFDSSRTFASSIVENTRNSPTTSEVQTAVPSQPSEERFDSSKAFTGSIVERPYNIQTTSQEQATTSQSINSQPSKPISRFKMQRR